MFRGLDGGIIVFITLVILAFGAICGWLEGMAKKRRRKKERRH